MKSKKYTITSFVFIALLLAACILLPDISHQYTYLTSGVPQSFIGSDGKANDFTVYDSKGNAIKLSDFEGQPVVVTLWASWCIYCRNELPIINKMSQEYGDDIVFLIVDWSANDEAGKDEIDSIMSEKGCTFTMYFDNDYSFSDRYNISHIPSMLFIDKDGHICKTYCGSMSEYLFGKYIEYIK